MCLPEPLLGARGTLMPPDDWPEGATLGPAWRLEAVCAGVPDLAADPPPPVAGTVSSRSPLVRASFASPPTLTPLAPPRAWMTSRPLPTRATSVPPSAWVISAPPLQGADPPMTLA